MILSSPIYKLKRRAKLLARDNDIRLHEALNQIATKEGFKDWSHLASNYSKSTPAMEIMRQVSSGDMVLIGARPGHGKTLLGLELTALAEKINRTGYVFTLDYNETDVWDRFEKLGFNPRDSSRSVVVDTSDNICAAHIIERLAGAPDDALVVVDYLQLLDQRRSNPPLDEQVRALKKFATEHGAIVVMISQIDRTFELSSGGLPTIDDIRLPNSVDLSLFDKMCFLNDGEIQIEMAA
ncbi:DNA helicase [Pacificibacter marinus]|uniref:Replicative DNA helicase n=1 Tax=Pacificibacter marinus TaxID=658057 RepID=A0A1Y5TV52_9RHOB|nr:DNA helicase [Pacificibacter marinus]SEL39264.1 DnaB-like helicase C terminal domain-containing protein [Pacificibacter marinus]SLN70430.1 Replicative DNA helicase [Pacificibacter marinus]